MAEIQSPLGILQGSAGPATFTVSRNKKYMRTKPQKKNPGSPAQIIQRKKFRTLNSLAFLLNPFIKKTFVYVKEYSTEFNEFISLNYESKVIIGEYPDFGYDYSKIIVSTGDLKIAEGGKIKVSADKKIIVEWKNNSGRKGEYSSDEAIALLISENKKYIKLYDKVATRSDKMMKITPSTDWLDDKIHGYLLFKEYENEVYSVSVYLGNVIISEGKTDMSNATIVPARYSHKARLSKKYIIKRRERGGDKKRENRNEIILQWDNYSGGKYAKPTKKAIVRLINDTKNTAKYFIGYESGGDTKFEVKLPDDWESEVIQVNLTVDI
jgi:hypothetical protein